MIKTKKITIRITENQLKFICERIIEEETTKSDYIRDLIENKSKTCRKSNRYTKSGDNTEFRFINTKNNNIK